MRNPRQVALALLPLPTPRSSSAPPPQHDVPDVIPFKQLAQRYQRRAVCARSAGAEQARVEVRDEEGSAGDPPGPLHWSVPAVVEARGTPGARYHARPLYRRVKGTVSPVRLSSRRLRELITPLVPQTLVQSALPRALCVPHPRDPRRRRPESHSHLPSVRSCPLPAFPHVLTASPRRTHGFIDQAITAGGRVYVHCGDGISRSPAVV